MSQRMRGQEATIRIAVDGQLQQGSMVKVKDFTVTPKQDIKEEDYLGETESDLDLQHHGFGGSFSVDMFDDTTIKLLSTIVDRERQHLKQPEITLTVIYAFREGAAVGGGKVVVYHTNLILKQGDEGFAGRKERITVKFEWACKRRDVLQA